MNCGRFGRLLWSYVEGELSPEQRQACEAHLSQCVRCRQRLQAAQLTQASLRALPRYTAPQGLMERVRRETSAQPTTAATRPVPAAWRPLGVLVRLRWALVPALGMLVALLWWGQPARWLMPDRPQQTMHATAPDPSQEYAETCIDMHQQLEMVEWAGTPTASYLVLTSESGLPARAPSAEREGGIK
jgi:anti-sigma factor RsiW